MTRCRFQIITTIIKSAASTLIDHEVREYKCDLSLAMHTCVFGLNKSSSVCCYTLIITSTSALPAKLVGSDGFMTASSVNSLHCF
jgi:hypothetical protein